MIYDLSHLREGMTTVRKNGRWVPARPVNYKYRSLLERIMEAWSVFIGECDAFRWPEGQ